jgi:hypothetical protein
MILKCPGFPCSAVKGGPTDHERRQDHVIAEPIKARAAPDFHRADNITNRHRDRSGHFHGWNDSARKRSAQWRQSQVHDFVPARGRHLNQGDLSRKLEYQDKFRSGHPSGAAISDSQRD